MAPCPCCGGEIPNLPVRWSKETRTVTRDGEAVTLAPREADVFDVLWRAHPIKLSYPAVLERVYANDPNGGPDSTNIVSVYTNMLRKKLKPLRVYVGKTKGMREGLGVEIAA